MMVKILLKKNHNVFVASSMVCTGNYENQSEFNYSKLTLL